MIKKIIFVVGVSLVLAISYWLLKPISPYLYLAEIDLRQQKSFVSTPIRFRSLGPVCLVFDSREYREIQPSDLAALPYKVRYSLIPVGDGVNLLASDPITAETERANTIPPNTKYLFWVHGTGDAKIALDFSEAPLRAQKLKLGVLDFYNSP